MDIDKRIQKEYAKAPLNADLIEGFDDYIEPKQDKDHPAPLDPILNSLEAKNYTGSYDILSFRNNFNKILATPYNAQNPWTMHAYKTKKNQILLDVQLDSSTNSRPTSEYQSQCCYAGRHYETLSTTSLSDNPSVEGNEQEEYCGVFAWKLEDVRLILAAEIDCEKNGKFVELKTFRELKTSKDQYVFERFKLMNFWIQSYLVGVPYIQCGFRTRQFELIKQQMFETNQLPHYGKKHWNPQTCLHFAHRFVQWLGQYVSDTDSTYVVTFDPAQRLVRLEVKDGKVSNAKTLGF